MDNQQQEYYGNHAQPSAPVDQPGYFPNYYPQQPSYPPQQSGGLTFIGSVDDTEQTINGRSGGNWFNCTPAGLFAEKPIRDAFMCKVYLILTLRLVFVSMLIGAATNREIYLKHSGALNIAMIISICVFFVAYLLVVFIDSAARTKPWNLIVQVMMTLGEGFAAALASCLVHTMTVMYSYAAMIISCLFVIAIVKCTRLDLTERGTTLCSISSIHIMTGGLMALAMLPLGYADIINILVPNIAALIVSMYVIFDLLYIMSGGRGEVSPEEPLFGAILLYKDIIKITFFWTAIGRFCKRVA